MPDRYPKDSVLVPQWTRVEDGLPELMQDVTYVAECTGTRERIVGHGCYHGTDYWRWLLCLGWVVTHWSPRVGIPMPEEE